MPRNVLRGTVKPGMPASPDVWTCTTVTSDSTCPGLSTLGRTVARDDGVATRDGYRRSQAPMSGALPRGTATLARSRGPPGSDGGVPPWSIAGLDDCNRRSPCGASTNLGFVKRDELLMATYRNDVPGLNQMLRASLQVPWRAPTRSCAHTMLSRKTRMLRRAALHALDGVTVRPGEVHGVVTDIGAGRRAVLVLGAPDDEEVRDIQAGADLVVGDGRVTTEAACLLVATDLQERVVVDRDVVVDRVALTTVDVDGRAIPPVQQRARVAALDVVPGNLVVIAVDGHRDGSRIGRRIGVHDVDIAEVIVDDPVVVRAGLDPDPELEAARLRALDGHVVGSGMQSPAVRPPAGRAKASGVGVARRGIRARREAREDEVAPGDREVVCRGVPDLWAGRPCRTRRW